MGSAMLAFGPLLVREADVSPTASAFWRLALALPLLWALAHLTRDPPPRPGPIWRPLVIGGLFFGADLVAWHAGIVRTTLANASLFSNLAAFLLPLWSWAIARRWPERRVVVALGVAALGTALLLGRSFDLSARNFAGDLLCILAAILYTGYLVQLGGVRDRVGAMGALGVATLSAGVLVGLAALALGGQFWPSDWRPLIALALGSQVVGQGLIILAVARLPAHLAGLGLLIQPVIGAMLGWAVYAEAISAVEALGMALVLGALAWVKLGERGRVAAAP
jgi:drug/metabolite transporter (DMT)-like permease